MEPEPQPDRRPVSPSPKEQSSAAADKAAEKAAEAAATAEAGAAAAAAAKVGGRHIVVTGHPVPEFCQRYSLPCVSAKPEDHPSAADTEGPKRAVAFENIRGYVLFWHVSSQSWVFGFGHKQQDLTEEELVKCATLPIPADATDTAAGCVAFDGTQTWRHKGEAVEITLSAFEDEKAAKESVDTRKHTWSSFDMRFCKDAAGFQPSPSDETMRAALACIPEHKALLEGTSPCSICLS